MKTPFAIHSVDVTYMTAFSFMYFTGSSFVKLEYHLRYGFICRWIYQCMSVLYNDSVWWIVWLIFYRWASANMLSNAHQLLNVQWCRWALRSDIEVHWIFLFRHWALYLWLLEKNPSKGNKFFQIHFVFVLLRKKWGGVSLSTKLQQILPKIDCYLENQFHHMNHHQGPCNCRLYDVKS